MTEAWAMEFFHDAHVLEFARQTALCRMQLRIMGDAGIMPFPGQFPRAVLANPDFKPYRPDDHDAHVKRRHNWITHELPLQQMRERERQFEEARREQSRLYAQKRKDRAPSRAKFYAQDWANLMPHPEKQQSWDVRHAALRMREVGLTYAEIGEKLGGISTTQACNLVRKAQAERDKGWRSPFERYLEDDKPDFEKLVGPRKPRSISPEERYVSAWETYVYA